jgi:hypothetical protein
MPQKKTRTAKQKPKTKTKTKTTNTHLRKVYDRTPTPYPFSPVSPFSPMGQATSKITSSSSAMKAVSRDGEHWHVDTDVNGVKTHANLTNSQIMDIVAYPAAKQDIRTRLLQELRSVPIHPKFQPQPQILAQNFGAPIIRMMGPIEEPKIEYIYKRGCSNKPVMLNKLSPLHEVKIVPESSGELVHLVPMSMNRNSMKTRGKGKRKTKSKKQNRRR